MMFDTIGVDDVNGEQPERNGEERIVNAPEKEEVQHLDVGSRLRCLLHPPEETSRSSSTPGGRRGRESDRGDEKEDLEYEDGWGSDNEMMKYGGFYHRYFKYGSPIPYRKGPHICPLGGRCWRLPQGLCRKIHPGEAEYMPINYIRCGGEARCPNFKAGTCVYNHDAEIGINTILPLLEGKRRKRRRFEQQQQQEGGDGKNSNKKERYPEGEEKKRLTDEEIVRLHQKFRRYLDGKYYQTHLRYGEAVPLKMDLLVSCKFGHKCMNHKKGICKKLHEGDKGYFPLAWVRCAERGSCSYFARGSCSYNHDIETGVNTILPHLPVPRSAVSQSPRRPSRSDSGDGRRGRSRTRSKERRSSDAEKWPRGEEQESSSSAVHEFVMRHKGRIRWDKTILLADLLTGTLCMHL